MTSRSAETPLIGPNSNVDIVVIVDGLANYIPDILASLSDDVLPRTVRDRCRHEPNPYNAAEHLVTFALGNTNSELHRRINRFIEERPDILGSHSSKSRVTRAPSEAPDRPEPAWEKFSEPAIFHGRDECVNQATEFLLSPQQSRSCYRKAVLTIRGEGGIGKSTVSRAVLAHSDVVEAFPQRRAFIACDAIESIEALEGLLMDTLGLNVVEGPTSAAQPRPSPRPPAGSGQHTRSLSLVLVSTFLRAKPALLVLDNFECVWNGMSDRQAVEQFLEELAAGCSLILTIRGAPPPTLDCKNLVLDLGPLTLESAKCAFLDFGGMMSGKARHEAEDEPALGELLEKMEGHALSIALLGRQAKSGYSLPELLQKYHNMTSDAASSSHSRSASLSASIGVSLDMQVLRETRGALDLCYLMARLPDGASKEITEAIFANEAATASSPAGCSSEAATRASADLAMEARSACFRAGLIGWLNEQQRWRMLAPIREFIIKAAAGGGSPLNEAKLSLTDIDSRIFDFYRDCLARDGAPEFGRGLRISFSLHADLRNIDQAMLRALSPPQASKLLATLTNLCRYLYATTPSHVQCLPAALKHISKGNCRLEEANDTYKGVEDRSDKARFLERFGNLAARQGGDEARHLLEEAGRLYDEVGDRWGKANILASLGQLATAQGRGDEARHLLKEAGRLYDEVGNHSGKADSLLVLGDLAREQGRDDEAQHLLEEAGRLYDGGENRLGKANSLLILGELARVQGRGDEARHLLEEAGRLSNEIGDQLGKANILVSLGRLAKAQGRGDEARHLLEEASRLSDEVGSQLSKGNSLWTLGDLESEQGRGDEARHLLEEAGRLYDKVGNWLGKANSLRSLGDLARVQGRGNEARHLLEEAVRLSDEVGDRLGKASSLCGLGELASVQGRGDEARHLLEEAGRLYGEVGSRLGKANSLLNLGELAKQQGRSDEARHLLEEAGRLSDEVGDQLGKAKCLRILADLSISQGPPGTVTSPPAPETPPASDAHRIVAPQPATETPPGLDGSQQLAQGISGLSTATPNCHHGRLRRICMAYWRFITGRRPRS